MTIDQQIQERRASQRSRCLKGARIVFGNGNSTLACRIRNQSENGLRLAANETGYVPKTFTLMPDGATQGQMCQVTWRSPTDIGVAVIADAQRSKKGNNHGNRRKQQMAERYPI